VTHRRPRRRRIKPRAPIPEAIRHFGFLKAMAYFEGALEACPRRECKQRRQCCGGPRGTMRGHDGVPFCRSETVVVRAARGGRVGDKSHGREWAAEKFAEFRKERQPQAAPPEEPKAPARIPLRAAVDRPSAPPADLHPEKASDPASAILELLSRPLDDAAQKELKVQLAALHERGALLNARYGLTQRQPDQEK